MFLVRLLLPWVVLAALGLLGAYFFTKQPRYLHYLKQLATYLGYFLIVLSLLFLLGRVIRF